MAAGFNAPISGVFFAVETVLRRQPGPDGDSADDSGVTVAMVCWRQNAPPCIFALIQTEWPAHKLIRERVVCAHWGLLAVMPLLMMLWEGVACVHAQT